MRFRSSLACLAVIVCAFTAKAAPGDEAPAWLQQAAAVSVPTYDREVPAVVLRNEQNVTVDSDGKISAVTRFAIRILNRDGRTFAKAAEVYLTKAGKVKDLHAWLIRTNGFVKKFGSDQISDQIEDANDIYNEYRIKSINASDEADTGVVFGYESTSEERPLFGQDCWYFQDLSPSLLSRFTLTL